MIADYRMIFWICLLPAMLAQAAPDTTPPSANPATAEQPSDEKTRLQAVLSKAAMGDADAQYAWAVLCEQGQVGSPADAQVWYQKAARQGQAAARAWMEAHVAQAFKDIAANMVSIDNRFLLARFDVTQDQWNLVMGANPSHFATCGYRCPVESVSWDEVHAFIQKLNQLTGQDYRLPTQSEWERACGMQTPYCGGSDLEQVAWYVANSNQQPQAVGQKQANAFGLYDMSGDVWQWLSDCYRNDCSRHIARGGAWNQPAAFLRSNFPTEGLASNRNYSLGFRLAMDAPHTFCGNTTPTPAHDLEPQVIENEMVVIDGKFKMSRYDITQSQWQQVMHYNPSAFDHCAACPVEQVSWMDVQYFINALNERTGRNYRLPTGAEWEYASGLQTGAKVADNADALAWNAENSDHHTHPVGQKQPNRYGLFDMSGNVKQWTLDCFNHNCEGRVTLGNSWQESASDLQHNNFGYNFLRIYGRANTLGFRLAEGL